MSKNIIVVKETDDNVTQRYENGELTLHTNIKAWQNNKKGTQYLLATTEELKLEDIPKLITVRGETGTFSWRQPRLVTRKVGDVNKTVWEYTPDFLFDMPAHPIYIYIIDK